MHDSKCEITAMPAAVDVSLPYALGITIVFRPRGIASEQSAQMKTVFSKGTNFDMPINARGIIISLIIETAYIFKSEKVFRTSICETVIPVRSIAIGDIQLPETVTTEFINDGSFNPERPIIMPASIAINIGFTNALSRWRMLCLPESAISRHGTAQR